jgi:Spy/CpxP family protein refolding chaperone
MNRKALLGLVTAAALIALVAGPTVFAGEPRFAPGGPAVRPGSPPEGRPPKPLVIQFKNIPAESFLNTIKQLCQNPKIREAFEQLPIAINEPANAVVIIGPPEAAEFLGMIAQGLDQPNEFRLRERALEHEDLRFRFGAAERGFGPPQGRGPMMRQQGGPPQGQGPMMRQQGGPSQGPGPMMRQQGGRPQGQGPMMRQQGGPPEGRGPMMRQQGGPPEGRGPMMRQQGGPPQGQGPMMRQQGGPPQGQGPMMRQQGGPPQGQGPMMRPQGGPPQGPGAMMRPPAAPGMPNPAPAAPPQARSSGFSGGRVEIGVTPGEGAGRFGLLLAPEARERLGLSDQQVERIRSVLSGLHQGAGQMAERMREALKDVPPQERAERMREMMEKGAAERVRRMHGAEETIMKVLSPEQREKFERWLRERRPEAGQPPAPPKQPQPGSTSPWRQRLRPGASPGAAPPAGPALQREPARFHLIEEAGAPPPPPRREPQPGEGPGGRQFEMQRAAGYFRLLEEPQVIEKLGLSPEQDKKLFALRERAKSMYETIRAEVQEKMKAQFRPDMTEAERQTVRREMEKAFAEAQAAVRPELEKLVAEASNLLSEEQREKLKTIARDRTIAGRATGGLMAILSKKAQEDLGLSPEQICKIKAVLEQLQADAKKVRDEVLGPGAEPKPEDLKGERFEALKTRHEELLQKAREQIKDLLTPEQREKAERMRPGRPGPGGPGGPMRPQAPPEAPSATKGYTAPI